MDTGRKSRARRLALFGAVLAVIGLVLLGFFAQTTTRRALERAEALQFRRMLVTRHGDEGYRFFFATNRALESGDAPLEDRFSNQRGSGLTFGSFDTAIEPSLGIGMLVNPTDWFQNEEIQLREVRKLARQSFVDELREQIAASPQRSLLINVNGFRERFPSALRKTAFLAHVLDIDTPLLVFDWPGDQGSSLRGYLRAQRVAGESGAELAKAIEFVVRELEPERVWLVANSMGAEVVVHAFSRLFADPEFADADTEVEQVVLTAPDVSHDEFGARFKEELDALARIVTVYVSSNDRALLVSRIINREHPPRREHPGSHQPQTRSEQALRACPRSWSPADERARAGRRDPGEPHPQLPQLQPGDAGVLR